MTKRLQLLAVALLAVFAPCARAQNPTPPAPKPASFAYRYRILGVYDEQTGDPLEGAEVADVLNGNKALTTKTGTVSLYFLPEGGALVSIRKLGYAPQTMPIAISPADTTPITITLSRAQQLPTVVVKDSAPSKWHSPLLRGFDERRKAGFGRFVTDSIFRKEENKTMADLLMAHLPGINAMPGPAGARYLVSSRKMCSGLALRQCRESDCYVSVYVDNVKIYDPAMSRTTLPDFSRMSPVEYAAAELYQGADIPPQYSSTNSECGVLLLWTRER
jgi:hypothetical protein